MNMCPKKPQTSPHEEAQAKAYKELLEFTHMASHDLRAPLRRIVQYCQILKDDFSEKLGDEGAEHVERLVIISGRMQRLVDDLLTYSRMGEQEEKRAIAFENVVADVVNDLDELISENNAVIYTEDLPVIYAYPTRIKTLLENLLTNAIKYRGKQDPVIMIFCEDREGNHVFSVKDNGAGMDKRYHEIIFKPFERLHTQDEIEGSGLGLAICRKAVEAHGGRIWAESQPDQGMCIKFTIPKET